MILIFFFLNQFSVFPINNNVFPTSSNVFPINNNVFHTSSQYDMFIGGLKCFDPTYPWLPACCEPEPAVGLSITSRRIPI